MSFDVIEGEDNNNIVIGNVEKAEILFTAHYDTPYTRQRPYYHISFASKFFRRLYFFIDVLILLLILSGVSFFSILLIKFIFLITSLLILTVMFLILIVIFAVILSAILPQPINHNNYNDNTSGIIIIIELLNTLDTTDKVAFILFDNEEKGRLGSQAFVKSINDNLNLKLILNFDCVADGNTILAIYDQKQKLPQDIINKFLQSFNDTSYFKFIIKSNKYVENNSDNLSFSNAVGITAHNKKRFIPMYYSNTHTNKDIFLDERNIIYLVNSLRMLIKEFE